MAVLHTTTITANSTAYRTTVGPSSRRRNFLTQGLTVFLFCPFRQSGVPLEASLPIRRFLALGDAPVILRLLGVSLRHTSNRVPAKVGGEIATYHSRHAPARTRHVTDSRR